MKKNRNGFTLIELIMVMIILGVLDHHLIPRYLDTIENKGSFSEDLSYQILEGYVRKLRIHKLLDSGRRI